MSDLAIDAMESRVVQLKGKAGHISSLIEQRRLFGKQKASAIARRDQYISEAIQLQLEINKRKLEIDDKRTKDDAALEALCNEVSGKNMRQRVETLRNEYMTFAEDLTRVASMRMMASQIANELTKLLEGK